MNNFKKLIINKSKELNIDLIGFTNSDFSLLLPYLEKQKKLDFKSKFQKSSIDKYRPIDLMDNTKTVISFGLVYPKHDKYLSDMDNNYVHFSKSSIGIDYHIVLKNKAKLLCDYIKSIYNEFEYVICVDTTIIDDRFAAYSSGIGFYGKNGLIINPKFGSNIYLGTILSNLEVESDKPLDKNCGDCTKCIDNCPNKAINKSGILNYKKCLSYITQKKEELSDSDKKNMNKCIYGCDICRDVCPYNYKDYHLHEEFEPLGIEKINLDDYKELSNKEFKKIYGSLSGSFIGKKTINRNILVYKDKIKSK